MNKLFLFALLCGAIAVLPACKDKFKSNKKHHNHEQTEEMVDARYTQVDKF